MFSPMYTNIREVYNGWVAYDEWLKVDKKFYKSVALSQASLCTLEGYLLSWYEDFGTHYLLNN